ncbi:hypothetical protein LTR78_004599 [Recurvomyces mirabilis]|uniref:Uncharacterized protein n=1 Tax=Recurvomyces mirabilis TaxID=574656 RepID=A0AAE1C2B3_9PEZI|nr:hypothetical protein LTR78_004599 [Recurvomyces mirabilis]KAK5152907.1 hypothetical protein LTS14_008015 [Recurvomyces mirabilis]
MDEELRRAYLEGYSSKKLSPAVISGSRLVFDTSKPTMNAPVGTSTAKRSWSFISIAVSGRGLPLLAIAGLISVVLLTLIFHRDRILVRFSDLGRYLRQRYDEYALVSGTLLSLEHNYTSLRVWTNEMWLCLRYNEMGDKIARLTDNIYFLPDNMQRIISRNLSKTALAVALLFWFIGVHPLDRSATVEVPMHQLPPRLAMGVPSWISPLSQGRKKSGSNSHHQRDTVPERDILMATDSSDDLGKAAGTDVMGNFELWRTMQTVASKQADKSLHDSSTAAIQDDKQYVSTTTMILESTKTMSTLESATDYWAPPKSTTTLHRNQTIWCRVCEQFHCCELPY